MAYTSDKKPGALTQVSSLGDTDNLVVEQSGDVKRATVAQIEAKIFDAKTATSSPTGTEVVVVRQTDDTLRQVALSNIVPALNITNDKVSASAAIADSKLDTIATAGKVANSATTATSTNTNNAIVARDGSGNFSAGTITATLAGSATGNAGSATILATGRTIALTGDVTGTTGSFNGSANVSAATTIANNAVTTAKIAAAAVDDTKIRNSAALSVIGRSANSTGDPADIAASADDAVLRRSGTSLGFGTVATGGITDDAVTDAKLRDSAALSVIGRSTDSSGDPADIAAATDGHVLRRSGTDLGFGTVATAGIADSAVTNAKFAGSVGLNAWSTKTTTYTAVAGDRINADTSGGAFTITLPATPATYTEVTLADHAGTWDTNNLTVARNGSNINGGVADLTCDVEGKQIVLRFEGATIGWRIYT